MRVAGSLAGAAAGLAGATAAVAEVGGAMTGLVRNALALAVGGAAIDLISVFASRSPGSPGARLPAAFGGAVTAAFALHLWTYHAAPVGTLGLAADLLYWVSLAAGGVLGLVLAARTLARGRRADRLRP